MAKTQSKGICLLCTSSIGKGAMTKHLQSCLQKEAISEETTGGDRKPKKEIKIFHILVKGHNQPEYWMHLQVFADARLSDLDQFLRDTWLECCGHLSAFEIDGISYSSSPMKEYDEKGMSKKLNDILYHDSKFFYEYDFGTPTALKLKVVSEGKAQIRNKVIKVLAMNEPPSIKCSHCEEMATQVCPECIYSEGGWLCDKCAKEHECGEDMLMPVVNSPRVGTCGYVGQDNA